MDALNIVDGIQVFSVFIAKGTETSTASPGSGGILGFLVEFFLILFVFFVNSVLEGAEVALSC